MRWLGPTVRSVHALTLLVTVSMGCAAACSSTDEAASPGVPVGGGSDDASVSSGPDGAAGRDAGVDSGAIDGGDGGDGGDGDGGDAGSMDAGSDGAIVPPRTLNGAPQRVDLLGNVGATVGTLGTLWTGYLSFKGSTTCPVTTDFPAQVVDGFGNTFTVIETVPSNFVKLPTPIAVRMLQGNTGVTNTTLKLENVVFELTSLRPPPDPVLGKSDAAKTVASFYGDLAGVALSVNVATTFFANFTSLACAQIEVLSNGTKVGALTAAAPSGSFAVTSPLAFRTAPTCQTARLPNPQNATADFALQVTSVALP